jgi:hypothetical protein
MPSQSISVSNLDNARGLQGFQSVHKYAVCLAVRLGDGLFLFAMSLKEQKERQLQIFSSVIAQAVQIPDAMIV